MLSIFSCKKINNDPLLKNSKCPLISVDGPSGNLRNIEWLGSKVIRVFNKDSVPTIFVFRYNSKNLAESMEISTDKLNDKYFIKFTYNDKNTITKSSTTLNGFPMMSNEFFYNESNTLSSINTTIDIFGKKITGKTRVEYLNKNVNKVYNSIGGETESVVFSGEKYDTKIQFLPEIYKVAALGFVGISNNYFSYFGENNMTQGKFAGETGKLDQLTTINYVYDSKGLPKQSESISTRNGRKKVEICSYSFGCK